MSFPTLGSPPHYAYFRTPDGWVGTTVMMEEKGGEERYTLTPHPHQDGPFGDLPQYKTFSIYDLEPVEWKLSGLVGIPGKWVRASLREL